MCDLSDEGQLGTQRLRAQALHRRTEADARSPVFFRALHETNAATFEAFGLTADSCLDAMQRVLAAYAAKAVRAEPHIQTAWVSAEMTEVVAAPRYMGEGYQDGSCLTGGR
jgi:hypothetical protein